MFLKRKSCKRNREIEALNMKEEEVRKRVGIGRDGAGVGGEEPSIRFLTSNFPSQHAGPVWHRCSVPCHNRQDKLQNQPCHLLCDPA